MHNKCMEFYGSFAKDNNKNNKNNLFQRPQAYSLTELHPLVTETVA